MIIASSDLVKKGGTKLQVLVVILAVGAIAFGVTRIWKQTASKTIHYPYWCKDCKAVFDVSELKKDYPKNWRIPPGAPSDSVVLCLRCNKGFAYPAANCSQCGTTYVLHLMPGTDCPKCVPEVAQTAQKYGIDLTPTELTADQ